MDSFGQLSGQPSKDEFAEIVLNAFSEMGVPNRFKYVKEEFCLTSSDGEIFNLHNFYEEYCRMNPSMQQEALRRWAIVQFESVSGISDDVEEALPNLRPKLWTRWSLEQLRFMALLKGDEWKGSPVYSVGSHLCVALVYDMPYAIASVSSDQLEKWQLSFYQALDAGRKNLAESTTAFANLGDGFYASATGDNYDASRIVLQEILKENLPVKGDMIVAAPNRDALLITGSEDEVGLKIMFDLVSGAMTEPRPMSPIPMRLVGDQWMDWDMPPSVPNYLKWREMQMEFLGTLYSEQKEYLEELFELQQKDLFVATYSGMQRKSGESLSFSIWGEGIATLLPKTDVVFLGRPDGSGFMVEWNWLEDVVGDLIEPTDNYPPRYVVNSFPSPEQMGRLESLAFKP